MKPLPRPPQRIGNLEYGTTETYFPHCKWGSRCGMGEWQKVSSHQRRWPTVLKLSWGGYIFMGPIHELNVFLIQFMLIFYGEKFACVNSNVPMCKGSISKHAQGTH